MKPVFCFGEMTLHAKRMHAVVRSRSSEGKVRKKEHSTEHYPYCADPIDGNPGDFKQKSHQHQSMGRALLGICTANKYKEGKRNSGLQRQDVEPVPWVSPVENCRSKTSKCKHNLPNSSASHPCTLPATFHYKILPLD